MASQPIVHVVDNDSASRQLVVRLAASMNLDCRDYASGLQFLEECDANGVGCLVSAFRVADVSGLQIQQRLLDAESTLPVIFVTSHASVRLAVRAMRAGAVDVLEKPCNEQELWEDIQCAVRLSQLREEQREAREDWQMRLQSLTSDERDTLEMLLQGARNREIASQQRVTMRTVEARRQRLLEKLEASSLVEIFVAQNLLQPGYCFLRDATCFFYGTPQAVESPAHFKHGV